MKCTNINSKVNKGNLLKVSNALFIADCIAAGIAPLSVSRRNKKLVPNAKTAFIIWNLPAVITCPGATPHCIAACYARKAETPHFKDTLTARMRNYSDSNSADFVLRMAFTILSIRKSCRAKNIVVRIHESGDFYNKEYAEKWVAIINACKGERIKFIAYTKSFDFFDCVQLPAALSLRASVWDDTPEQDLETIARNGWRVYTAVDKFRPGDNFTRCRCSDCATCGKCWANYPDIRCEIH